MALNSMNARARALAAIHVLIAAAPLSGCSVGQQSQTAVMQPAVNGPMADLNDIALRNIRVRAAGAVSVGVPVIWPDADVSVRSPLLERELR